MGAKVPGEDVAGGCSRSSGEQQVPKPRHRQEK